MRGAAAMMIAALPVTSLSPGVESGLTLAARR
jgi:hypothetical protein